METMKDANLYFQRNGVAGESFYQLTYTKKELGFRRPLKFIATFYTNESDKHIVWSSCRVTTPAIPELAWRGDVIAGEIDTWLHETFGEPESFYDFIQLVNAEKA